MHSSSRFRWGGVALGTAAVLLAAVPLVRPFLPRTVHAPVEPCRYSPRDSRVCDSSAIPRLETRAIATPALVSTPRLLAHVLGGLALALLLVGGWLALHAGWTAGRDDPVAFGSWSGSWREPGSAYPRSAPSTWPPSDSGGTPAGRAQPSR
jgi:hypothetical protein